MIAFLKKSKYWVLCTGILLGLSLFGCLMTVIRYGYTGRREYFYLIWNLFLAWIPFGISVMMSRLFFGDIGNRKICLILGLGIPWLLFYPNAPYMITDFIHFEYSHSFLTWYDLVIYTLFIFTSLLLGFISLYLVSRIIEKATRKIYGWLFVLIVLFISSYGVYLGRFIRWNSWDILIHPLELAESVFMNINARSMTFSLIYGSMLTLVYAFLYGLTQLNLEKTA